MANGQTKYIFAGGDHDHPSGGERARGGVFRRAPGDGEWESLTRGLPPNVEARAFAVHPDNSHVIYAGTQDGPYRTTDAGERWERVGFPDRNVPIYAITYHPTRPKVMYAGAAPVALYRSEDGGTLYRSDDVGASWRRVDHGIKANGTMMSVTVARADPKRVYCVSRCGQVFGTEDEGASWREYPLPPNMLERVRAVACI